MLRAMHPCQGARGLKRPPTTQGLQAGSVLSPLHGAGQVIRLRGVSASSSISRSLSAISRSCRNIGKCFEQRVAGSLEALHKRLLNK